MRLDISKEFSQCMFILQILDMQGDGGKGMLLSVKSWHARGMCAAGLTEIALHLSTAQSHQPSANHIWHANSIMQPEILSNWQLSSSCVPHQTAL